MNRKPFLLFVFCITVASALLVNGVVSADPANLSRSAEPVLIAADGVHAPAGKNPKNPTATPEPTAEPCSDCPAMYVSVVTARYLDIGQGKLRQICDVEVRDANGDQVSGAAVTAEMTNDWIATLTELTQEQGYGPGDQFARFGPRDFKARCGNNGIDAFTCTVTDVTHGSFTYDPGLNAMDTDTAACP